MTKTYLIGGKTYSGLYQTKHPTWGDMLDIESQIKIEFLSGQIPFIVQIITDTVEEKHLFYGFSISNQYYAANNDFGHIRKYSIGSYLAAKYYLPFNIFLQMLIGCEYEKAIVWEDVPQSNTIYIPKAKTFGFGYEIQLGYSIELKGNVLIEPSFSYKRLQSTTYYMTNRSSFLPRDLFNIYLGFLYRFHE